MSQQLKKSKAQLEREKQAQLKKLASKDQLERAKEKKGKKKRPTRGKVFACGCVSIRGIRVKMPGLAGAVATAGFYPVPIHYMTNGAEFHDKMHGKGKRLHNPRFAKGKFVGWTCVVCGVTKNEEGK